VKSGLISESPQLIQTPSDFLGSTKNNIGTTIRNTMIATAIFIVSRKEVFGIDQHPFDF
jgi:hypothetical protein